MKQSDADNIEQTFKRVKEVCTQALAQNYQKFDIVKYGSAINGLSVKGQQEDSDLDLIIVIPAALSVNL